MKTVRVRRAFVFAILSLQFDAQPIATAAEDQEGVRDVSTRFDLGPGKPLGPGPARENSGIVRSRRFYDLFWMQNDSGDEPRIYPVHRDGTVYENLRYPDAPGVLVGGAINVDWEDIAINSAGQIIVGDIGNNDNDRRDLVLYVLPEPAPGAGRTTFLRKVFFRYPTQHDFPAPKSDFNYDAEALFTIGDNVYLCTKHRSDHSTKLYRIDLTPTEEVQTAELLDDFHVRGQVTGADATADGRQIVLLTYDALWLFEVTDRMHPLSGSVKWLPYSGADDAEAVCFAEEGALLVAEEATARIFEVPIDKFVSPPSDVDNEHAR